MGETFAEFTYGGQPDDTCAFVGYKNPVGSGAERQWTAAATAAYILSKAGGGIVWQPNITALTGAGGLSQVSTLALTVVNTLYQFVNSGIGALQSWQLVTYTGQSGSGTQLPDDFNAGTNNKIWIQVS